MSPVKQCHCSDQRLICAQITVPDVTGESSRLEGMVTLVTMTRMLAILVAMMETVDQSVVVGGTTGGLLEMEKGGISEMPLVPCGSGGPCVYAACCR